MNELVTEYTILAAEDPSTLSTRVNDLLEHGWEPQGGVCVCFFEPDEHESDQVWAQAMVRRGE